MTLFDVCRHTRRCAVFVATVCLGPMAAPAEANAESDRSLSSDPALQKIEIAPTTEGASGWSAAPTVETLLQLDAQAALVAERKRIDRLLAIVRPSTPPRGVSSAIAGGMPSVTRETDQEPVVLNAIYGVGGALTAEITIDGERQRLRTRSRGKDAGHDNDGDGIVRIDHARQCVVLRRAGVERSACLTPAGSSFAGGDVQAVPEHADLASDLARATPVMLSAGSRR